MQREEAFMKKAAEIVSRLTEADKLMLLTTHQHEVKAGDLTLPEFYIGTEVARGYVGREAERCSTVFPQPVGMAATFDPELMEQIGAIAGDECRAYHNAGDKGALCVWGPTVDMERDPRWGRTEEAYGEDVLLAGEMTAAYTRGLAGDDPVFMKTIPTLKHFCANNCEAERVAGNSYLPPRLKYEYYYAAFMPAVKYGGARSVMTAYNEINGVPALANPELKSVLKDDWGLWFVVTDGADFSQTVTAHRWCNTHAEAYAEAVKAGCDIMTDDAKLTRAAAEHALEQGLLTWEDIDAMLLRVIGARLALGMGSSDCPYDAIGQDVFARPQSAEINRKAALEQLVLLKNDGMLPVKHAPANIAVVGCLADENLKDWYTGSFSEAVSPLAGIRAAYPQSTVTYDSLWDLVALRAANGKYLAVQEDGTLAAASDAVTDDAVFELQDWGENWQNLYSPKYRKYVRHMENGTLALHNRIIFDWFTRETFHLHSVSGGTVISDLPDGARMAADSDGQITFVRQNTVLPQNVFFIETVSCGRERAEQLASSHDLVIYCTGNHPVQVAKECFDRKTLALNVQSGMAAALARANPRTVMVLISGYPYAICEEQEVLPAILYSTHAGPHLGTAIASAVSGAYAPAGRLSMTWYRSEHELPAIGDYDIETAGTTYLYFKGEPLYPFGYGLSYAAFRYHALAVRADGSDFAADVTLENCSGTDSDEVVQVYYTVRDSAVTRPEKKLCGFARVHLAAGETRTVSVRIPAYILQFFDTHSERMMTEAGTYRFFAGGSSADLPVCSDLAIDGEKPAGRAAEFSAEMFDAASGIRLFYAKELHRHYARTVRWNGNLVYRDVPFSGKKTLVLHASSVFHESAITADCAGEKLEISLQPSLSYDDFRAYSVPLPDGLPDTGTLVISMQEGAALLRIALESGN